MTGFLRRHGQAAEAAVTLIIAVAGLAFVYGNVYLEDVTLLVATYSLIALGLYVPFIMGGALSMAYNAYLGIGAYTVAVIATRNHLPLGLAIPVGMAISAVLALVLGFATRRLSGFFLAAVTVLFGVAFTTWLIDAASITGGGAGLQGIPHANVFGVELGHSLLVAITVGLVWLIAVVLSRLRRSPFGVAVRASRRTAVAVEASGVRVTSLVLVALALGATIASIGGSMFALVNQAVVPESFAVDVVFLTVFTPLLGGQDTPWGAVLGAFLVVLFTFQLNFFRDTGSLLFALAVLVILVAAPRGLIGLGADAVRFVVSRRAR